MLTVLSLKSWLHKEVFTVSDHPQSCWNILFDLLLIVKLKWSESHNFVAYGWYTT